MRAHGRKPFPGIEDIPVVTTLRHMDDNSLIIETRYLLFALQKDARKIERARLLKVVSSFGSVRFPQKTGALEWNRHERGSKIDR
jgi:hypothetical protein